LVWIEQFSRHPAVLILREALAAGLPRPVWRMIPEPGIKALSVGKGPVLCPAARHTAPQRAACRQRFLKQLRLAQMKREGISFACPAGAQASIFPLTQGGRFQGVLTLCHRGPALPRPLLRLGMTLLETAIRETDQAQELKTLSQTIQPRCVALSTVHTIHRLISSTLNLKELLPRVARLCCQVLRSESCVVWLRESGSRQMLPRAAVRRGGGKSSQPAAVSVGKGPIGKVAATLIAQVKARSIVVPLVEEECLGILMVRRGPSGPVFGALDHEILVTLAEQAVVAIRNAQMYERQEKITWDTIRSLSAILDGMGEGAGKMTQAQREILAAVTGALAVEMRLPEEEARPIQYAALLHDAGRVGPGSEILKKSSKLSESEVAQVRQHPVTGARFLEPMEILEPAIPIVLYHHERYDGTGYPKGLKGEQIPPGARILAVANAFEAMIGSRPYRKQMTVEQAVQEIASHAGTQFDPKVVQAFLQLQKGKKLEQLVRQSQGRPAVG